MINYENKLIKKIKINAAAGKKIYIYGGASGAEIIYEFLKENNLQVEGCIVDREYYQETKTVFGAKTFVSEPYEQFEGAAIIIGIGAPNYNIIQNFEKHAEVLNYDFMSLFNVDGKLLDSDFYNRNISYFNMTRDMLSDELSREIFDAFCFSKITGEKDGMEKFYDPCQYFPKELISIDKINNFVDCGAFIGDSFTDFLKIYNERTGKAYKGKAYLIELDESNIEKIPPKFKSEYQVINKGLWDKHELRKIGLDHGDKTRIELSSEGVSIELDKLDNIFAKDIVDFIKMDIEGAELRALEGGKKIISKYHPTLAISIYHRREDLIEIPKFIKSISPKYKLYLRAHSKSCVDVVCYALYAE